MTKIIGTCGFGCNSPAVCRMTDGHAVVKACVAHRDNPRVGWVLRKETL